MLGDDDDVFDSVTWESPTNPAYDIEETFVATGPGFRQSTVDSEEGRGPNDPKWEGYLITSVKDPVKELAETKDAYVSYLVSAKVGVLDVQVLPQCCNPSVDQPIHIFNTDTFITTAIPRLCLSQGASCQELPCMCCSCITRQAPARFVQLVHYIKCK